MHDILGYAVNLQYEYLKNEIPDILSKYNFKIFREAFEKKKKIPHSSLFLKFEIFHTFLMASLCYMKYERIGPLFKSRGLFMRSDKGK